MELDGGKWFPLRCTLFTLAAHLTSHDLDHMKFLLADCLPRQELEKARSPFALLCLLSTRKELLSPNKYSFLEEILKEVGKNDFIKGMYSEVENFNSSSLVLQEGLDMEDYACLQNRCLDCLSEQLTRDDVQTLGLFFVDICESLSYADALTLSCGKHLVTKLQKCGIIALGDLYPLHKALILIGRLDLATTVEQFCSKKCL